MPKSFSTAIDTAAKIAAIVTPVLVALGGWYVSSIASDSRLTLDRFDKSSPLLASISAASVDKKRDVLFSLIETHRPDLLRRAIAYIDNDLEYQHTKKLQDAGSTPDADAKLAALRAEFVRFNTERDDLFQPLVLGALAADDADEAEVLIDAAPSILHLYHPADPTQIGQSEQNLDTLLDFAVDKSSSELVRYLLNKGLVPSPRTGQKAIRRGDITILTLIAQKTPRAYAYSFPIWQTAARSGTVEQIDLLRRLGFAKDTGTAIGEKPIVTEAALTFDAAKVMALVDAGFPISEIDEAQQSDLLLILAKSYFDTKSKEFDTQPLDEKVSDTMFAVCSEYRARNITADDISQREMLFRRAADDRTDIFRALVAAGAWSALRCAREFYAFEKSGDIDKIDVFEEALIREGGAEKLIDEFGFPIGLRDSDGRSLLMIAAQMGNAEVAKRLSRSLDISKLDNEGKGIYSAILESQFIDPEGDNSPGFFLHMKKLNALLDLAQSGLGINFRDRRGYTPMMIAIESGNVFKIRSIIKRKPDLNVLSRDGQSALSLSASEPELYVQLYSMGARQPGHITDCASAQKLMQWLEANAYSWHPFHQPNWNPEAIAKQSSKDCPVQPGSSGP